MIEDKPGKKKATGIEELPGIHQVVDDMVESHLRTGSKPLKPEELLDYIDGELPSEQHRAIQERLICDKEAVRTLLDLEILPQANERPSSVEDAAWLDFKHRLEEPEMAASAVVKPVPDPNRFPHILVHGLLAVACLVLAFTGPFKTDRSKGNRRPDLGVNVLEVRLDEVGTRGSGKTPLRFQGPQQTLYMKLPHRSSDFPYYGFEILDTETRLIFSELVPGPRDHLDCLLSDSFFQKPGIYTIRVFGMRDEKRTKLGDFDLLVTL